MGLKIINKRDLIIIICILFIGVGGVFFGSLINQNEVESAYAKIYINNRLYKEVSLDDDQVVVVEIGDRYNKIKVSPQSVVMLEASCHNQDCMHQGEITPDNAKFRALGNWIICLPNSVTVEVVRREE